MRLLRGKPNQFLRRPGVFCENFQIAEFPLGIGHALPDVEPTALKKTPHSLQIPRPRRRLRTLLNGGVEPSQLTSKGSLYPSIPDKSKSAPRVPHKAHTNTVTTLGGTRRCREYADRTAMGVIARSRRPGKPRYRARWTPRPQEGQHDDELLIIVLPIPSPEPTPMNIPVHIMQLPSIRLQSGPYT